MAEGRAFDRGGRAEGRGKAADERGKSHGGGVGAGVGEDGDNFGQYAAAAGEAAAAPCPEYGERPADPGRADVVEDDIEEGIKGGVGAKSRGHEVGGNVVQGHLGLGCGEEGRKGNGIDGGQAGPAENPRGRGAAAGPAAPREGEKVDD